MAATTSQLFRAFGARVRELRTHKGLSQEAFAFECGLDRTYVSQVERGKRNISLENIDALARALEVPISGLFAGRLPARPDDVPRYEVGQLSTYCGFDVGERDILRAAQVTAEQLQLLPFTLFQAVDLKTLSSIVGALFAGSLAREVGAIVNPIEKGHPDIVPRGAAKAPEERLRNYPEGLEIKVTVGNVRKGSDLLPGTPRIDFLSGLTWQAHHREVKRLLGLVVDFSGSSQENVRYPIITGAFYSDRLRAADWGKISGTTGRNTKVSGMKASGKAKMGETPILIVEDEVYRKKYLRLLGVATE